MPRRELSTSISYTYRIHRHKQIYIYILCIRQIPWFCPELNDTQRWPVLTPPPPPHHHQHHGGRDLPHAYPGIPTPGMKNKHAPPGSTCISSSIQTKFDIYPSIYIYIYTQICIYIYISIHPSVRRWRLHRKWLESRRRTGPKTQGIFFVAWRPV